MSFISVRISFRRADGIRAGALSHSGRATNSTPSYPISVITRTARSVVNDFIPYVPKLNVTPSRLSASRPKASVVARAAVAAADLARKARRLKNGMTGLLKDSAGESILSLAGRDFNLPPGGR